MDLKRASKGWQIDSPAKIHPKIIFGAGIHLTPTFVLKQNITHVINCAFDEHSPFWFRRDNPDKYVCLQAIDSDASNITFWYPKFEETLSKFLQQENSIVFVHCQCGVNRSAYLVLLYACKKLNYSFEKVERSILLQRPCAFENPNFKKQVLEYIKDGRSV
jgi:protein-tyrosine phosphatase